MKKRTAIGIDVGGTISKIGMINENGVIVARVDFATSETKSPGDWLNKVESIINNLKKNKQTLHGIGVGVPGFVDFKRGYIHQLTNIKNWKKVPLAKMLSDRFSMPAFVDNDVNAMALGECTHGAGRIHSDVLFATLGTGVGGAIYINGSLYRGAHSMAGEIGHVSILMNGCKTPQGRGGLETYVGIKQISQQAVKALRAGRDSSLKKLSGGDESKITPKLIAEAAHSGDLLAIEIFDKVSDRLAAAFASATYLLQPEVIIVGGGVSQCGSPLFTPLRAHLKERLDPIFASRIIVKPAMLGNNAGMIGGASMVFDNAG